MLRHVHVVRQVVVVHAYHHYDDEEEEEYEQTEVDVGHHLVPVSHLGLVGRGKDGEK